MLSLRSCCSLRHHSSFSRPLKALSFSRFPTKPFSFSPYLQPFSYANPSSIAMSSRPSAFDALMSGARAAAKKKPQPKSSSPTKRKTLDSNPPLNPSTPSSLPPQSSSPTKRKTLDSNRPLNPSSPSSLLPQDPISCESSGGPEEVMAAKKKKKKILAVCADDRIAQLKSKMPQLKLKAGDFSPQSVACWGEGERVPFMFVCLAFDMISKETGRILITDIVCNVLRTVMHTTPDDLVAVVYLAANRIAPAHEGLELGIGDASIIKALAEACGRTDVQVKKQYKELGDLGLVAKASRSSQSMMRKPDALTVTKVFNTLRLIAKAARSIGV